MLYIDSTTRADGKLVNGLNGTTIAVISVMALLDLVIIYLAIGAPVAVYGVTKRQIVNRSASILRAVAATLVWPAEVMRLVVYASEYGVARREARVILRTQIESITLANSAASTVFEFRKLFDSVGGLHDAASEHAVHAAAAEIYKVARHPQADLATRCLMRKNRQKLEVHFAQTRDSFVRFLADVGVTPVNAAALTDHICKSPCQELDVRTFLAENESLPNRLKAPPHAQANVVR